MEGAANVSVRNIDVPMLLRFPGSGNRSFSSIVSPSICSAARLPAHAKHWKRSSTPMSAS